jgi:FAD/FMN-containing dehydrogenase
MTATANDLRNRLTNGPVRVNDIHSKLNPTDIADYRRVSSIYDVYAGLQSASEEGRSVAICGGGHAMGGQQFSSGGTLLDMSDMNNVLNFDAASGLIEVEAGIQWPKLLNEYLDMQCGQSRQWGLRQKQTGADRLSIGGALAANIHGRVLTNKPIIEDIVSFRMIDAGGRLLECSRSRNFDLFRLAIGGYGLFGVIVSVTMQLVPRQKMQRVVEIAEVSDLQDAFASRISDGYVYGDLQFQIDSEADGFLQQGIFSCYRPVANGTPIPLGQKYMTEDGWQDLLYLAHVDKSRAFERFAEFYLGTSGQIYWSDEHQFTTYLDDYHSQLDQRLCNVHPGSEMITELYVPPENLCAFVNDAKEVMRSTDADIIYGTIRLIRADDESFLAWAKRDYACVIFNLHVEHSDEGIAASRNTFRKLIDTALAHDGAFFLTYHRHASKRQVEQAYPEFSEFLDQKQRRDPRGLFSSDWYQHHLQLFGGNSAR